MVEQTKTKPQATPEFKMNEQMQTFSFNLPVKLVEEGKWLLAVSCFEGTDSVFITTNENNCFSISTLGLLNTEDNEEVINKLKKNIRA